MNANIYGENDDAHEDVGGVVLRREQVRVVLFEGKSNPAEDVAKDGKQHLSSSTSRHHGKQTHAYIAAEDDHGRFGSLAAITGRWTGSDNYLPDWLEEGTESSLRDSEADMPQVLAYTSQSSTAARSIAGPTASRASPVILTPTGRASPAGSIVRQEGTKAAYMDLDKFYEDTEETEDSEESGSEGDDDSDEEEDEEASGEENAAARSPGGGSESSGDEDESEDDSADENSHLQGTTR